MEQTINIEELIQDEHNFNKGTEEGQRLMERSFKELGAGRSVLIDKNGNIIAGNKSQRAAIAAGITKVRVIETDGSELVAVKRTDVDIDSKEGRELALADNLTTQVNLAWDETEIQSVMDEVEGFEPPSWGFDVEEETEEEIIERRKQEFEQRMAAGELDEDDPEYQEFLQKFEAKKTTDDCYTPELIYEAVAKYVEEEYNVSRANFKRPFYPGGDYQKEKYLASDIVVDNPPFSILSSILDWYNSNNIKYFLFGPHLTLLGTCINRCTCIPLGVRVTYANGAMVSTGFATNMDDPDIAARSDAKLYKMVFDADLINYKNQRIELPKYQYPRNVLLATHFSTFSRYGNNYILRKGECYPIAELDHQKEYKKAIYGKGYLISDRKKEERIKAEEDKRIKEIKEQKFTTWELSERELEIIKTLK